MTHQLTAAALCLVCLAGLDASAAPPDDERMTWFREAKFGLFIHWGLYAVPAGAWGDATHHGEWIMTTAQIPVPEYEQFLDRFNPVEFDADRWARTAKAAGMKYIVITSKHHDGFCLFDSAHTDYDVMSTPFQRDIMAELAEACRRHGLRMCWYHSIMDWHHPDYLPRRGWEDRPADDADFDRYVAHLHDQVTELLTKYGDIGIMWFDGEWEGTWNHGYGQPLYDLCRELQPQVIVNNRVDKGRGGMGGLTEDAHFAGDYGTPEQQIPATGLPGVDWETCMTMNRHWGYNANDDQWKSSEELIQMLVDIVSKGGNYLLNVGPTALGTFPPESEERLAAMGEWLDVNGEAIYATTASPFPALEWGRCTARRGEDTSELYLHVFDWPKDGRLVVPGLGNDVRAAELLATGRTLESARNGSDVALSVPSSAPDEACSVIRLTIDGPPIVYVAPRIVSAGTKFLDGMQVSIETDSDELVARYTLDGSDPTEASPRVDGPVRIDETCLVSARSFHHDRAVSPVARQSFTRVTPRPAETVAGLRAGLRRATYLGDWSELPDFSALTAAQEELGVEPVVPDTFRTERVGHRCTGYLRVPHEAMYVLELLSDDGSRLWIGDELVVDNDGLHGPEAVRGLIALEPGDHPVRIEWFNRTGGAELTIRLGPVGRDLAPAGNGTWWHRP